jgi:hypothetical protein
LSDCPANYVGGEGAVAIAGAIRGHTAIKILHFSGRRGWGDFE